MMRSAGNAHCIESPAELQPARKARVQDVALDDVKRSLARQFVGVIRSRALAIGQQDSYVFTGHPLSQSGQQHSVFVEGLLEPTYAEAGRPGQKLLCTVERKAVVSIGEQGAAGSNRVADCVDYGHV